MFSLRGLRIHSVFVEKMESCCPRTISSNAEGYSGLNGEPGHIHILFTGGWMLSISALFLPLPPMLTHTAMWAGIPLWVLHLKAQNYAITLAFFLLEDRTLREEIHNSILFHSIANACAAPSAALTSLHGNVVEWTTKLECVHQAL